MDEVFNRRSNVAAKTSGLLNRKVLGIKVMYLAAIFVVILGIYAVKVFREPNKSNVDDATESDDIVGTDGGVYPTPSDGTVYVVQNPDTETPDGTEERTNEDWLSDAIGILVTKGNASPTGAQAALQKYLNGDDLSYQEKTLVDKALEAQGTPPEITQIGKTAKFVGKPGAPSGMGFRNVGMKGYQVVAGTAASNGSKIDKWQLQVSYNDTFDPADPIQTSSDRIFDVTGKKSDHMFRNRVRAHNAKGWGPWSTVATVKTRKN